MNARFQGVGGGWGGSPLIDAPRGCVYAHPYVPYGTSLPILPRHHHNPLRELPEQSQIGARITRAERVEGGPKEGCPSPLSGPPHTPGVRVVRTPTAAQLRLCSKGAMP